MMRAARAMMDLTRAGPMFEGLRQVHEVLDDPSRTGLILVALPEEMPVNETLDLWNRLGDGQSQVRTCVLNQVHPRLCSEADWSTTRPELQGLATPAVAEAMDMVTASLSRSNRQDAAHKRLASGIPVAVVDLPALPHRVQSAQDLQLLSTALHEGLQ
jgi:anion-transporting  ArsA/GET3 family ATPase